MTERLSVNKINKLSKNREVWCWGCGFQYGRMIKTYCKELFAEHIVGLIDTNRDAQGTTRYINDRSVEIFSPESLCKKKNKKILLIITCDAFNEVKTNAQELYGDMDIIYTQYPSVYYSISAFIKKVFFKVPLKRRLLFYVGSGSSQPHENADEIVRYLNEEYQGKKYDVVYMTDTPSKTLDTVKQISLSTGRYRTNIFSLIRYFYLYTTAQYLLFENSPIGKLRKDQKTIYLNHGTIPLKYVRDALKQPKNLNYAVCPGPGCTKFFVEQYSVEESKLIYFMQPRVRKLFEDKKSRVDEVLNSYGEQLIVWLPTFRKLERGDKSERKDSSVENPIFALFSSEHIHVLDELLRKNKQKLILKCHPREKESLNSIDSLNNILVISDDYLEDNALTLHNLMNRSDGMISDYSGITFEYTFMDKPIGYYIPDYEQYTRGFAVEDPFHYMPGEKMYTVDDLIEFFDGIKNGTDTFAQERRNLRNELFGNVDPRRGAEELIRFIDDDINID